MATIQDVAKRAGVSTATVSHVLNGTRKVLPQTRLNVEQAIAALNYRPSLVARGLQTNITRTVGVLVADVTSFFFAQIVRELEAAFEPQHYNLMLCNTDEQPEREARYLEMLFDKRVDGVIMVPTGVPQPILQQFVTQRVPVVSIHRKPGIACGPSVLTDDVDAAYQATEYLINLGHKRIGVLARGQHLSPVIERTQGYMCALRAHGIAVDERLIETNHQTAEQTMAAAKRLFSLTPPITAVIAMSLTSMLGLLKAMRELDVRYPDQVSVIGIGDAPWMEVLPSPLTVMSAPIAQMCEEAAGLTLDAIAQTRNKDDATYDPCAKADVLVKAELVVRSSCKEVIGY
ncbi:MAG: LacI family transcriptional regulator [Anaerolineae bacterium]|nr:LacI family transcriptional regulator [Anaerolineae bacterium]